MTVKIHIIVVTNLQRAETTTTIMRTLKADKSELGNLAIRYPCDTVSPIFVSNPEIPEISMKHYRDPEDNTLIFGIFENLRFHEIHPSTVKKLRIF